MTGSSRGRVAGLRWAMCSTLVLFVLAHAACTGDPVRESLEGPPTSQPLQTRFVLDEAAFNAPQPPRTAVPFDVVSSDMDLDGDPDLLVNWHNLARLELFENRVGELILVNPADADRSGLYENEGITNVYAPAERMLAAARAAGRAGVYVWHDPNPRQNWNFLVVPQEGPVTLKLRANKALTLLVEERLVRRRGEFEVELAIDTTLHFQAGVAFVATQLSVAASLPVFVGADLTAVGTEVDLWKDDPHGAAWVDVRGTPAPEIFITRGGLMGTLLPPHDPKRDRFFEYTSDDPLFADRRSVIPAGYGRGRSVEWVDIDGDTIGELYIGNTDTPNVLLAADDTGGYADIAPQLGIDFSAADTFAWFDLDADGRDDLVFVDEGGFSVAYNRGNRSFEIAPGAALGLHFPAASQPDQETLFATLSLNVLDFDNDGRLDLWLSGHGEERRHALYRATGDGFEDVTEEVGLDAAPLANSIIFLDIENDGYLDAMTIGLSVAWLHNEEGRRFLVDEVDRSWGVREFARGVAVDVDSDGRTDVVLVGRRRLVVRNETLGGGRFLRVALRASPTDPVGALVTAFYSNGMARSQRYGSALVTQYSQGLLPLHFGVPPGIAIDRLEVRWSEGRSEVRTVAPEDGYIELQR